MTDQAIIHDHWSSQKKIGFRFFFLLLLLYIFFFNNGAFPFFNLITYYPTLLFKQFIPWLAVNVLKVPYTSAEFTGSGDTTHDYLQLGCITVLSLLATLVWSVLDRQRKNYNTLYYWLLLIVRYFVAFTLINYGMVKIIKLQFPYPNLTRLVQPFGDASPMGLAWTFLGFSKGYNMFMGILEVSAGLLFFRKTMVPGAFIALAASAHVMAMNFFYDVPVKILSTFLVVCCLFILAPYLAAIGKFFFSEKPVSLNVIERPRYKKLSVYYLVYIAKYVGLLAWIVLATFSLVKRSKIWGDLAKKPPLYGIYYVERHEVNGQLLTPFRTNPVHWDRLIIQRANYAGVKMMNDSTLLSEFAVDTLKKQITFVLKGEPNKKGLVSYTLVQDKMILRGTYDTDSLKMTLRRVDLNSFNLNNRKFNWINEYPNNR